MRPASDPGKPENPYRFAGKSGYYSDDETGLQLLGARYYDPLLGRFITQDPSRDGLNWYAYAGNNPVNAVDATGRRAEPIPPIRPYAPEPGTKIAAISRGLMTFGRGIVGFLSESAGTIAAGAGLAVVGTFALVSPAGAPDEGHAEGFETFDALKKAHPNRAGFVWHHIVEQRMIKRHKGDADFAPERIHSVEGFDANCVELPIPIHNQISAYYSAKNEDVTGKGFSSVRAWMNTLDYDKQRYWGLRIVDHIQKGVPVH